MKTPVSLAIAVCSLLLLHVNVISAHHSFATHYDYDKEITVTGAVTDIRLANPHSFFEVDVTVEDGSIETWEIEGNSIPLLARAGITADTFRLGETVTVTGMLSRDPDRTLMFGMLAEKPNGESYHLIRPDWDRPAPSITLVRGASQSSGIRDFAGIWLRVIRDGEMLNKSGDSPLPLNEKGIAARDAYNPLESQYKDCLPLDMPSLLTVPYPMEFRVTDDRVDVYHEYNAVLRQFVTDGMPRPSHETDQYGVSSARVAGNEMTVVTDMFLPSSAGLGADFDSWGKGANVPSSRHKRLTETYRLLNDGTILELSLTLEDPEFLSDPFNTTMIWARQPEGTEIYDFDCDVDIARRSTGNAVMD